MAEISLISGERENLIFGINSRDKNLIWGYSAQITAFAEAFGAEVTPPDGTTVRIKCPNMDVANYLKSSILNRNKKIQ